MPKTFTTVELLWMLVGLFGSVLAMINVRDAWRDFQAVKTVPDTIRRARLTKMAVAGVRQDTLRFVQCATIALIGLFAGLTRPPIPKGVKIPTWTPVGIALTAGLFLVVLIILLQMLLDWRLRKAFLASEGAFGAGPVRRPGEPRRSTETLGGGV